MNNKRLQVLGLLFTMFLLGFCLIRYTGLGAVVAEKALQRNDSTSIIATSTIIDQGTPKEVVIPPLVEEIPAPADLGNTATVTSPTLGGCFVGGCSGQICSDKADAISTCQWHESYACYSGEVCQRQESQECGWTPSPKLNACLLKADSGLQFNNELEVQ
jgi:hypothetical protein